MAPKSRKGLHNMSVFHLNKCKGTALWLSKIWFQKIYRKQSAYLQALHHIGKWYTLQSDLEKTSAGCIGMAGLLPFKILDGWANLSCFDRITSWWYITAEYDNGHDSDDGNDWDYDDAAAADDDDDDDNHRHLPPCHLRWPFPCETTWSPSDFMEMSSISERW